MIKTKNKTIPPIAERTVVQKIYVCDICKKESLHNNLMECSVCGRSVCHGTFRGCLITDYMDLSDYPTYFCKICDGLNSKYAPVLKKIKSEYDNALENINEIIKKESLEQSQGGTE